MVGELKLRRLLVPNISMIELISRAIDHREADLFSVSEMLLMGEAMYRCSGRQREAAMLLNITGRVVNDRLRKSHAQHRDEIMWPNRPPRLKWTTIHALKFE